MIAIASLAAVSAAGVFLVTLGVVSLASPGRVRRFLLGFAATPARHYAEIAARAVAGGAFVASAGRSAVPDLFRLFGWVLLATTAGLLLVPWRWHDRFARAAVPRALRFLPLIGVSSVLLGALVLAAIALGDAPD